jgi:hypothetical protein
MDEDPRDTEHLRLLVIAHYVGAALSVAGLAFLGLHYLLFRTMIEHAPAPPTGSAAFEFPFAVFSWLYVGLGSLLVTYGVLNLVSARCIAARRARHFSIVVAALDCVHMPLGAALGVMTMLVLTRDSVRQAYGG